MGITPETTIRNAKGEIRVQGMSLDEFKARCSRGQDDLIDWFWLGQMLVHPWLNENIHHDRVKALCRLPKVEEFLLRFAVLADDLWHKKLTAKDVYHFYWLCEDAEDQINACYNALCYDD